MKQRFAIYLAALFALVISLAYAQTAAQRAEQLRIEAAEAEIQREELMNLQKETVRALQLHNSSFFNRVYSDDFLGTIPSGANVDKTAWVAEVQDQGVKYSSFVASDIRIRIYQNTAVSMCLWSSRGTHQGATFFRQSRVTIVYVYGQRGWQVVTSQETQLPG